MSDQLTITVNGMPHVVATTADTPLLYVLRNELGLNGPLFGCGLEQCGTCTVLRGTEAVRSCNLPVGEVVGSQITTLEGLGTADEPHPVQQAFIEEQAAQCGYCSPGLIVTVAALLWRHPHPTDELIRAALDDNLCRFLGGARNAPTNYTLANQRIMMHGIVDPPLRTSAMRSLGGAGNTFANESFIDELAYAAEVDPLAFRLSHLDDPRGRDVLEAAARAAGWGVALPDGEGLGVAFACYENNQAYVATVAHVAVDEATSALRVRRIVVVHDCGLIVNPDGVRNQVEGNVIQALSRALKEEVRFDAGGQTTVDWEGYPLLTFSEVPELEIVLINRPNEPSVGAGEPTTVTVAAAVANAVYAATRARLRRVPFTPDRVRAALAAR